jgi:hypothetical protein
MEDKYLLRGKKNLVKTEITNSIQLSENPSRGVGKPLSPKGTDWCDR